MTVTLDGSGSADPDSDAPLTYGWSQTGGAVVALSSRAAVSPTFVAPPDPAVLSFTLVVTDHLGFSDPTPDEIVVTVTNPPVADAGADQTVYAQELVTLDGSASIDPDGDTPLSYAWAQIGGPEVALSSRMVVSPTFFASESAAVLTFSLAVTDSLGLPDLTPDQVIVTVEGQPPVYLPLVVRGSLLGISSQ
jgi:hypothetical protein